MTVLTALAVLLLALASVYATVKAWSAACSLDLVSWMCWGEIAKGLGSLLTALLDSALDR